MKPLAADLDIQLLARLQLERFGHRLVFVRVIVVSGTRRREIFVTV